MKPEQTLDPEINEVLASLEKALSAPNEAETRAKLLVFKQIVHRSWRMWASDKTVSVRKKILRDYLRTLLEAASRLDKDNARLARIWHFDRDYRKWWFLDAEGRETDVLDYQDLDNPRWFEVGRFEPDSEMGKLLALSTELGRPPSRQELAAELGISLQEVARLCATYGLEWLPEEGC